MKEAEEETESEDDDDIAVDFNERSRETGTVVVEKAPAPRINGMKAVEPETNGKDGDLDIDDI